MADGSSRTVTATTCRVEHGTVIFTEAVSLSLAIAADQWRRVEQDPAPWSGHRGVSAGASFHPP